MSDTYPLHKVVTDDVLAAMAEMRHDNSPTRRRTFVRAVFAAVEVLINILKTETLELVESRSAKGLSPADVAVLREEGYAFDSRGRAYASPKFLPTAENFRFALETFMRASGEDYSLETGTQDWEDFRRALVIRNRIVHPRSVDQFEVSADEASLVERSFVWATRAVLGAMATRLQRTHLSLGLPMDPLLVELRDKWGVTVKAGDSDEPL